MRREHHYIIKYVYKGNGLDLRDNMRGFYIPNKVYKKQDNPLEWLIRYILSIIKRDIENDYNVKEVNIDDIDITLISRIW